MSQLKNIIRYLQPPGRKISAMQALNLFGCWNLKGRMFDIKKAGYPVDKEMFNDKRRKKTYAKYFFK